MSDERLLALTRAMSDAVRSGLSWAQTLRRLGGKLAPAAKAVEDGSPVYTALEARGLFPPLFIALLRAGEESGKVDAFLDRYADSLETRIDFRRRLTRALTYPAFAVAVAFALLLIFLLKAAPLMLAPLVEAGLPIPKETGIMIMAGDWLTRNWMPLALGVLAVVWAASTLASSPPGRWAWALAGHLVPGLRYAVSEARHHDFEATLSLLLSAGLRPRQMVEILRQQFRHDPVLTWRLSRGGAMLSEGKGFAESLGDCLPPEDRDRFAVAESSGRLDEALAKLAKAHREAQLHRLRVTATALQISATVALAPVCFGLILALLWPSISMLKQAGPQMMSGLQVPAEEQKKAHKLSGPVKPTRESRFNEANAKKVLSYMKENEAPAGEDEEKKPAAPKLGKRRDLGGKRLKGAQPTAIKSFGD